MQIQSYQQLSSRSKGDLSRTVKLKSLNQIVAAPTKCSNSHRPPHQPTDPPVSEQAASGNLFFGFLCGIILAQDHFFATGGPNLLVHFWVSPTKAKDQGPKFQTAIYKNKDHTLGKRAMQHIIIHVKLRENKGCYAMLCLTLLHAAFPRCCFPGLIIGHHGMTSAKGQGYIADRSISKLVGAKHLQPAVWTSTLTAWFVRVQVACNGL